MLAGKVLMAEESFAYTIRKRLCNGIRTRVGTLTGRHQGLQWQLAYFHNLWHTR